MPIADTDAPITALQKILSSLCPPPAPDAESIRAMSRFHGTSSIVMGGWGSDGVVLGWDVDDHLIVGWPNGQRSITGPTTVGSITLSYRAFAPDLFTTLLECWTLRALSFLTRKHAQTVRASMLHSRVRSWHTRRLGFLPACTAT